MYILISCSLLDNYLGTTLSCTPETLQLLGASALLLAGKCVDSVQSLNLSLPILCASADDAFTVNELKVWHFRPFTHGFMSEMITKTYTCIMRNTESMCTL